MSMVTQNGPAFFERTYLAMSLSNGTALSLPGGEVNRTGQRQGIVDRHNVVELELIAFS